MTEAPVVKRHCRLCLHCHVEGFDQLRQPLTHCHIGCWETEKTVRGANHTRMFCDCFESAEDTPEKEVDR